MVDRRVGDATAVKQLSEQRESADADTLEESQKKERKWIPELKSSGDVVMHVNARIAGGLLTWLMEVEAGDSKRGMVGVQPPLP
jgi:hypothetical protein